MYECGKINNFFHILFFKGFPHHCSRFLSNMGEKTVECGRMNKLFHIPFYIMFPQCCSKLWKYISGMWKCIWKNEFILPHSSFHNVPAKCSISVAPLGRLRDTFGNASISFHKSQVIGITFQPKSRSHL